MPAREHRRLPGDLGILAEVRALVAQVIGLGGFPDALRQRMQLAVEEAVTNVIRHGLDRCPADRRAIELGLLAGRDEFRVELLDHGAAFDPRCLAEPDLAAHVAAGRSHGLGVLLMRRLMDDIDYRPGAGGANRLVMIKRAAG